MKLKYLYNSTSDYRYRFILELSFIISILIIILFFSSFKQFPKFLKAEYKAPNYIEVVDIPKTIQTKKLYHQAHHLLPKTRREKSLKNLCNLTVCTSNTTDLISLPSDSLEEFTIFALSQKPILLKKIEPEYPKIAIKTGVEGIVVIKALIDKKGNIERVELLKSIPMLDQAAIAAAMQFKYKPGKQRDRFVKVWVSMPFRFYFKSN